MLLNITRGGGTTIITPSDTKAVSIHSGGISTTHITTPKTHITDTKAPASITIRHSSDGTTITDQQGRSISTSKPVVVGGVKVTSHVDGSVTYKPVTNSKPVPKPLPKPVNKWVKAANSWNADPAGNPPIGGFPAGGI
jgi:hypothetical protein